MRQSVGCRSGDDIAIGAGGLGLDSLADQVGYGFANSSPPLRRSFGAVLPRRKLAEMDSTNSLHASAYCGEYNEDLIFLCCFRTDCE